MTEHRVTRLALVGCGYWGKNLARNFHQLGVLAAVVEADPSRHQALAKEYPAARITDDLPAVLGDPAINAVAIATPAETHATVVRQALLANKHVFVEKPLCLELRAGYELVELAETHGLVLMVGHLLQYHPAFVRLKEMAGAGELGKINYIYSHRLNLGKIRQEEDILWSFAPHDISMILALAGDKAPTELSVVFDSYLTKLIADVTITHLRFPTGMRAHIFVSWLNPFKEQKLVVMGERKMAVFDDTRPWAEKLLLYPHRIEKHAGLPVPIKAEPERVALQEKEPLRTECEHFLGCVARGERPITDGREGLRVLDVLQRCWTYMAPGGFTNLRSQLADSPQAWEREAVEKPFRAISPERVAELIAEPPSYFAHPSAVIDEGVEIGAGSKIWHFSHVLAGSRLGEGCNLGQNVVVGPKVTLGKGCKVQNNVSLYQGVTLEDHVFCGPSCVFTNDLTPRAKYPKGRAGYLKTLVREGASIGANATIVCGITIGRWALIGSGAVVTKDVPDHALMVGVPAKQKGWACECGSILDGDFRCKSCSRQYEQKESGLVERRRD